MYFSFAHKIYLIFLFAIPLLIFFHFYGLKNIGGRSLKFANFEAIARVKGIDLYSKSIFVLILNLIFLLLLVLAISGLTFHEEREASSFSFVIAIDSSESMEATDLYPNRLAAAKETAISFINTLPYESYTGVISFSGETIVEQDVTKNKQNLIDAITGIEISPVGGTDINEAVWNSLRLLRDEENKAIILLSDGQINVGELGETVEEILDEEVMIHTIGIGTIEGGEARFGMSKLDEKSLKSLAYYTGGKYFSGDDKKALEESFNEIINATKKVGSRNLSSYLIIAVIILFVIKQFLMTTRRVIW